MVGEKSAEQQKADELNAKIIMMMMEFDKNKSDREQLQK
jgi:hypothetical protein